MTKKYIFPKAQRILKRAEYQSVLQRGTRSFTNHFILFYLPNSKSTHRLGLIVSRKAGKSVQRNRLKRVLREYFRLQHSQDAHEGPFHDLVCISKKNIKNITLKEVCGEMKKFYENEFYCSDYTIPKDPVAISA